MNTEVSNPPSESAWCGAAAPIIRKLGHYELIFITDRTYALDAGQMFGVAPKSLWSKVTKADAENRLWLGMNSLLIRLNPQAAAGEGRNILIETGAGNKLNDRQRAIWQVDPQRDFLTRLAHAGTAPEAVDMVVNTHLHFDHCGWNTVRDAEGRVRAAFPRARYYLQRGEWEHAREQHERDRISYLSDNYDPLVSDGQMTLLEGERELAPGIQVEVQPGHTRHQQIVIIHSAGETACYLGDLLPTHWHLQPTWITAFDLDPLAAIASKHRVLERARRENWLMIFTHDPEWPWARVEFTQGKYRWVKDSNL